MSSVMTASEFRQIQPAFADVVEYPDVRIDMYLDIAEPNLPANRWKSQLKLGTSRYVAHNLSVDKLTEKDALAGKVPGVGAAGILSSKSVGSVSASYDVQSVMEKDAGWWNQTVYGREFYNMMRIVGMGGVQL